MSIILSIMGEFFERCRLKSIIGKKLSMIGRGLCVCVCVAICTVCASVLCVVSVHVCVYCVCLCMCVHMCIPTVITTNLHCSFKNSSNLNSVLTNIVIIISNFIVRTHKPWFTVTIFTCPLCYSWYTPVSTLTGINTSPFLHINDHS